MNYFSETRPKLGAAVRGDEMCDGLQPNLQRPVTAGRALKPNLDPRREGGGGSPSAPSSGRRGEDKTCIHDWEKSDLLTLLSQAGQVVYRLVYDLSDQFWE